MTFVSVEEAPDKVSFNNNKAAFLRSMWAQLPFAPSAHRGPSVRQCHQQK